MIRHQARRTIIACILTFSPGVWAQGADSADKTIAEDSAARVRSLYRNAQLAFSKENYEESRTLLLEAWAITPSSDVALALAQAELELALYRDCAEHLEFGIRNFSAVGSGKVLEAAKQTLLDVKTHVGQVNIVTNREGADIRVDGRLIGKSPLSAPVYVLPGQHDIEARLASDLATERFEVDAGKTHDANLIVGTNGALIGTGERPSSTPLSVPLVPHSALPEEESSRSIVPVIVGASVFAIGLAGAIGFRLRSDSEYSDAKTLLAKDGAGFCKGLGGVSSDCATLRDLNQHGDNNRNWSTVGILTAVTAVAATSAYWLWPRTSNVGVTAERANWRIVPVAGSNHTGLLMTGEF